MSSVHPASASAPGTTGRVGTRLATPNNVLVLAGLGVVAIIISRGAGVH
jgi:hypothetical protein